MMWIARSGFILGSLFLAGCRETGKSSSAAVIDTTVLAARETRLEQTLGSRDSTKGPDEPIARWILSGELSEISGLALTADGRLLAHGDERGIVDQIDYRRGVVVKRFTLGKHGVRADFEGITTVGDIVFMLASNGNIYEFREGAEGERVDYSIHDTQLGRECEFEGIAYDPAIGSLLLACKVVHLKHLHDHLVIYRWSLHDGGKDRITRIDGSLKDVLAAHDWKELHPSDITIDPFTGNYILISAQQKALIWVKPDGQILSAKDLPSGHDQAEGLAITRDSILIISDEAVKRPAVLTLYRWH
ncbi:MAG: SdiA-regulated domain-containing protein [Gemmatimonadota bacterium]